MKKFVYVLTLVLAIALIACAPTATPAVTNNAPQVQQSPAPTITPTVTSTSSPSPNLTLQAANYRTDFTDPFRRDHLYVKILNVFTGQYYAQVISSGREIAVRFRPCCGEQPMVKGKCYAVVLHYSADKNFDYKQGWVEAGPRECDNNQ